MAHKNIIVLGNSIEGGFGDTDVDKGYVMRGLEGQPAVGVLNLSRGGDRLRWLGQAPQSQRHRRWRFALDATDVIVMNPINDITAATFNQVSDITGFQQTILSNLLAIGVPRVWFVTALPNPATTDGFITTANQTPNAGTEAVRVPVNTFIRGTLATLGARVLDAADWFETSRGSGVWKAGPRTTTGDITSGSPTIANVADTTLWQVGQAIGGTGIPSNTIVNSIAAGSITMSKNATQTAVGRSIGFSYCLDGIHPNVNGHIFGSPIVAPVLTAS